MVAYNENGGKSDVHAQLRSIPINETVESPSQLLPFEDIMQVVDNYEFYSVSHCCCRMRYNLDADYPDTPISHGKLPSFQ